jgi:hypothetical protein
MLGKVVEDRSRSAEMLIIDVNLNREFFFTINPVV